MQFTIPGYLFSTALPIKQFNSEKNNLWAIHTLRKHFFYMDWTSPFPLLRLPPTPLPCFLHPSLSTITFEKIFKRGFQLNGHDIVAPVLSCRIRLLVKNELKTPFCTASHAPQTGFFRFPIADSNLEIFDENEKFQMPVAALHGNKNKIQMPVAAPAIASCRITIRKTSQFTFAVYANPSFVYIFNCFSQLWQPNSTKCWYNVQEW